MIKKSLKIIGSGWSWLLVDIKSHKLSIDITLNQDTPYDQLGKVPLFGIDMWEHAYYLKYFNRKAEYLQKIWSIINWSEIDSHFRNIIEIFPLENSNIEQ